MRKLISNFSQIPRLQDHNDPISDPFLELRPMVVSYTLDRSRCAGAARRGNDTPRQIDRNSRWLASCDGLTTIHPSMQTPWSVPETCAVSVCRTPARAQSTTTSNHIMRPLRIASCSSALCICTLPSVCGRQYYSLILCYFSQLSCCRFEVVHAFSSFQGSLLGFLYSK